jgi:hypothetical protein
MGHGDGADDHGEAVEQVGQVERLPEVEQDRHQQDGDQPDYERHPAVARLGVGVICIVKPSPSGRREKQSQNQQDLDFLFHCPPLILLFKIISNHYQIPIYLVIKNYRYLLHLQ